MDENTNLVISIDKKNREKGSAALTFSQRNQLEELRKKASKEYIFNPGNKKDKNEEEAFFFIRDAFIPELRMICRRNNPEIFHLYNGNMCRQAAIYGIYFLKKIMPGWEFELYEADYKQELFGNDFFATHAVIFAKNKKEKRIIDMSRQTKRDIWAKVSKPEYPKGYEEYDEMEMIEIRKMNWKKEINTPKEIFGKPREIIDELEKRLTFTNKR